MTNNSNKCVKILRQSTINRNRLIIKYYNEVCKQLGEYANLVPRAYIYEQVSKRTGYCTKKIRDVVNHFRSNDWE